MATSQSSTVTKIYDLQVIGFTDVDKQLKTLAKDFELVKKAKQDLQKASGSSTTTSKELDEINKRLADQTVRQKELTLQIKEQTEARQRLKLAAEQEKTQVASQVQGVAQNDSIKKAREENKALRAERDLLNTSTAEGSAKIAELNLEIDKNNELIKKNSDVLAQQKINIGNYEGSAKLVVEALKKIEDEIVKLQTKQQGLQDLQKKDPIGFKLAGGEENLNKTTQALAGLTTQAQGLSRITSNPQFLNIAGKTADATAEVKFFTKALVDLELQGEQNSQLFIDIQGRLAKLTDTIKDNKEEIRALASDTRRLDLVAGSFKAMADGAQIFVGAQALVGKSNADVQKSLQTLLAVQGIATAVRSLADEATKRGTALNKAYAFVLGQVKILTDANAAASAKWMAALKLGIIGAIVAGVVLLITNLDKLNGKQKELSKGLEGLQGVSNETKEVLKSMGKTIDEVAATSTTNLKEAIKSLNQELGKTPTVVEEAEAALQLLNARVDTLVDDLNNNTFSFARFLQGIGGAQASFGTLSELAATGDKIKENTELLRKFKELQAQQTTKAGVLSQIQDTVRAADLQIDANNRVLANEKSTLDQRLAALRSNLTQRRAIINANLSTELINAGKDAAKRREAEQRAHQETIKAERDFQDQILSTRSQGAEQALTDSLARIDALRSELLAKEKTRVAELQKDHDLSFAEEAEFLRNTEAIELAALNAKIRIFQAQKSLNAQELAQLAEFQQDKAELELKTARDIQKLREDEFKRQAQLLKAQADADIAAIRDRAASIQASPTATPTEKATARTTADQAELARLQKLNKDIDKLQKELNVQTLTNARVGAKDLQDLREKIREDQRAFTLAVFEEIEETAAVDIGRLNIEFEKLRAAILANDKLTVAERERQLSQLGALQKHTVLSNELKTLTTEFNEIKRLYLLGLRTEKEFLDAKAKMDAAANALAESEKDLSFLGAEVKRLKKEVAEAKKQFNQNLIDEADFIAKKKALRKAQRELAKAEAEPLPIPGASATQSLIGAQVSQLFGFDPTSDESKLLGAVIAQSFQVATDAMHAYFDAEQTRIQQSLDLQLKRVEVEKQQSLARAQSQAEIDSINKQAAAKEITLRRQAGEQLKKAKLAEAKISLATELANIAAAAAANPLNGITFGAAGAIMYGILAALALARYALNVSNISRQQFGRGKLLRGQEVPERGGRFGGKPHSQGGTRFGFKGREYEAEVDELAIIRTRNAPKNKTFTVTGTQTQIASAINKVGGGEDFAPGAVIEEKKRTVIERIFNRGGKISEDKTRTSRATDETLAEEIRRRLEEVEKKRMETTETVKKTATTVQEEVIKKSMETTETVQDLAINVQKTATNVETSTETKEIKLTKRELNKLKKIKDEETRLSNLLTTERRLTEEKVTRGVDQSVRSLEEATTTSAMDTRTREIHTLDARLATIKKTLTDDKTLSTEVRRSLLDEERTLVARGIELKNQTASESSSELSTIETRLAVIKTSLDHVGTLTLSERRSLLTERRDLIDRQEQIKKQTSAIEDHVALSASEDESKIRKIYEDHRETSIIKSKSITDVFAKSESEKKETEEKAKVATTTSKSYTTRTSDYYGRVVDRVISENRHFAERRDRDSLVHLVIERIFSSRERVATETMEMISRIVEEKLMAETNKVFKATGSATDIVTRLDRHGRETFAFGGEVPLQGGRFGGRPHSQGGTKFKFKGSEYEAEVDELAIIRTRNAPKGKRYTISGTTMEIASQINQLGGGKAFAPGAKIIEKFATGGVLGTNLAAPVFLGGGGSEALIKEVKALNDKLDEGTKATLLLAEETGKRIDRLKAIVVAQDVTSQQNKDLKKTQVGTL